MMRNTRYLLALALLAAGCSAGESGERSGLLLSGDDEPGGPAGAPPIITVTNSEGEIVIECAQGGDVGEIHVEFDCDEITVYTCKDLSNVVLELADGSHHKVMGVNGHSNTFSTNGAPIAGVWVKSGENGSGDGPGYGERFDAPEQDCDDDDDPPDAGCPSTDPDAPCGDTGLGGSGGDGAGGEGSAGEGSAGEGSAGDGSAGEGSAGSGPCSNDPDAPCGDTGIAGSGDPLDCLSIPDDPRCRVD
jgi:hypothetical protein